MKKFIIFTILIVTNIIMFHSNQVTASNIQSLREEKQLVFTETIKNQDGSYTITSIYDEQTEEGTIQTYANNYLKTSSKVITHYSATNSVLWRYTLTADFIVTHGSYTMCIDSYYTKEIYGSGWSFSEGEAGYSGATAYGKGKFTYKVLFVTVKTIILDVGITCDIYGNIIENN